MSTYAVIHTGGKQYRVSPGDTVRVEKLTAQPGDRIEIDQVYLLAIDGRVMTGNPVLKNTRVVTKVLDQDRGKKIIIFKHKRRKGYRKTTGHRQYFTELKIIGIIHEGASYEEQPEKQRQLQKSAVIATALVSGKADAAKQQTTEIRRPESRPDEGKKQEKKITEKPAPQQPEKQTPPEQILAPESTPAVPVAVPQRSLKEEPSVPAVISPEPERPQPLVLVAPAEQPGSIEREKKQPSGKRGLWWIIAIIAALMLLALIPLIESNRPSPRPDIRQEAGSKPAQEKQSKTKPPVHDVKTKETVRVDKPTAPAQPPD